MSIKKNVGLIECNASVMPYSTDNKSPWKEYDFKKVFIKNDASEYLTNTHFPQAEIVGDINAIIEDQTIDLVIISGSRHSCLNQVSMALQAGKRVRFM